MTILWDECQQDDTQLIESASPCPVCDTNNLPIGRLGTLEHYTCRACGLWYNSDSDTVHEITI